MEHRLRCWKPRGPSAKLRARLFPGSEQVLIESPSAFGGRWAWFAPVMGCFLAMMVITGSRNEQMGYLSAGPKTDWLTAVANNQAYAAYIVSGFHSEQNAVQRQPIEWTNGSRVSRTPGSLMVPATNSLIQN